MQSLIYFLLFGALFLIMMRFGCGSHVMGHGHRHGSSSSHGDGASGRETAPAAPAKAVDPVCKMTVETANAKSSVYAGNIYYFCSQDCREKFEQSPVSYAGTTPRSPANTEQDHDAHH
jgi:YHS domain-containing protein